MVTITEFKNKLKDKRATLESIEDNFNTIKEKIETLIEGAVGNTDDEKRIDYNNIEKEIHDIVSYINISGIGGKEVRPILKEVLAEKKDKLPKIIKKEV